MTFKDKVVVVTGGAQGIGKCIAECFEREGATVHIIDKRQGSWFVGDLANKATLERFAADVVAKSGNVDVLVNNAMPLFKGVDECSYSALDGTSSGAKRRSAWRTYCRRWPSPSCGHSSKAGCETN